MMKYSIFQEHSHSRFVYFRFSGDLFPVVMIDGDMKIVKKNHLKIVIFTAEENRCIYCMGVFS